MKMHFRNVKFGQQRNFYTRFQRYRKYQKRSVVIFLKFGDKMRSVMNPLNLDIFENLRSTKMGMF